MLTIEEILKDSCTGCFACVNVCYKTAITCSVDEEGFYIPKINKDICTDCGLCYVRCPSNLNLQRRVSDVNYIAQLKDREAVKKSASGGAFVGIAQYFLSRYDGVVIGAAISEDLAVRHCAVSDIQELKKLQNSKYVQSFTGDIIGETKRYLNSEKKVLFSGTPCQIAGLYAVLDDNEKDNLLTVDIVCHGVPSPALLKRQLDENSDTWQGKVTDYKFRVKKSDGGLESSYFMMMMMMIGPPIVRLARKDVYYNLFLKGIDFRESCYNCKYASVSRVADFTIGDCDSRELYPEFYPEYSNSILLINSDKAKKMWEEGLKNTFYYADLDLNKEAEYNHQLKSASVRPAERSGIYKHLLNDDWDKLRKSYCEKEKVFERYKLLMLLNMPEKWKKNIGIIKSRFRRNNTHEREN